MDFSIKKTRRKNKMMIDDRSKISGAKRIVIKVGTSTVTYENGSIHFQNIERLAWEISGLMNQGKEVILVTSGAIGVGVGRLRLPERPVEMGEKQAVAAIGQCELMNIYSRCFSEYSYMVGQVLLTKDDLDDEITRENITNTFSALLKKRVLPVVNENDTVSTKEILHNGTFGDNDALSAHVAVLMQAEVLIILSDIDALYDCDPRQNPNAKRLSFVPTVSEELETVAGGSGSNRGTGGMITKISAMAQATQAGIAGVITKGGVKHIIEDIMEGKDVGTFFSAKG